MTKTFKDIQGIEEACWVGYKKVGMKKKGNKMVPNCVPESVVDALFGKDYIYEVSESIADMYKGTLTPAQIAKSFRLTRGAITNTLNKLELSGYVHVRPDWEDARRKMVSISPAGIAARNNALIAVTPIINELAHEMGEERLKAIVPILRELRQKLE